MEKMDIMAIDLNSVLEGLGRDFGSQNILDFEYFLEVRSKQNRASGTRNW